MQNVFVSGTELKKRTWRLSHEKKTHKVFEVPCCRSKCVPKTNLNSRDVMFKFWNIWRNKFQDKFSTP